MSCGTLAALALTAAGTGTQMYAQNREASAANNAVNQEVLAQNQYAKAGQNVFQNSLNQSTPQAAQQQISQGQKQALQSIQNAQAQPLSLSMPSLGQTNAEQQSTQQGLTNQAAANYTGQSNYPLQQYLKDLQANSQLGVIGAQAKQQATNFPTYLQAAMNSQQGLMGLGQLLDSGGMLAGMYGMTTTPYTGAPSINIPASSYGLNTLTPSYDWSNPANYAY